MAEHCPLCDRRKEEGTEFCNFHETASANLETAYITWSEAFENLVREEYYSRLEELNDTGSAVKEVIGHLRGKGEIA